MLDNQLFQMLRQALKELAPLRGLVNQSYLLRYQPTQQGIPDTPTIWMHKVGERRIGTAGRKRINTVIGLTERETQRMETTIQFTLKRPNSTDPDALTSGDVMKILANVVQAPKFLDMLREFSASVMRVTEVRPNMVRNDSDQWADEPSFDLVIQHVDIYVDGVPEIKSYEFRVIRVPDIAA